MSTVAPTLATMIGLGVGIDYALFIVTRHFRGLKDGLELRESIARAVATSGGAVAFAGGTVTIALVSLAVAGIPLVTTMGLMAAIAVVVAVLAALTLLPAMLAITGPHINSLRVRGRHPDRSHASPKRGLWARWANGVARHPVIAMLAALAISDPAGGPAAVTEPRAKGRRRAVHLDHRAPGLRPDLAELQAGVNGPLIIAVSLGSPAQPPASSSSSSSADSDPRAGDPRLQTLQKDVSATSGVAAVSPVQIDKAGTTAYFNAIATTGRRPGHRQSGQHAALQRDPRRR